MESPSLFYAIKGDLQVALNSLCEKKCSQGSLRDSPGTQLIQGGARIPIMLTQATSASLSCGAEGKQAPGACPLTLQMRRPKGPRELHFLRYQILYLLPSPPLSLRKGGPISSPLHFWLYYLLATFLWTDHLSSETLKKHSNNTSSLTKMLWGPKRMNKCVLKTI